MRVLIVEDDEVIASTMSRGLTLHGYVVDHVPSAEAASAALLSEQFDLAIVDLGLPQEDGTSLVRRIRKTNRTLPVIVIVQTKRQVRDEQVTAQVQKALRDDPWIYAEHITVTTQNGVVRVEGDCRRHWRAIQDTASMLEDPGRETGG